MFRASLTGKSAALRIRSSVFGRPLFRENPVARLKFDPTKTQSFTDPWETPTYGIPEAAHYLNLPEATLRSWVLGRFYPIKGGRKPFRPLISIADPKGKLLSFMNLAEAHVLSAFRRVHGVSMENIRTSLAYLKTQLKSDRSLISEDFETDGLSLFITRYGRLIDVTAQGQQVMRAVVRDYLTRLDREDSKVVRLWPFTRSTPTAANPRTILIDPCISFGRVVVAKIAVPTAAINERFAAGESIAHLAEDYDCESEDVEEAIRFEQARFKAAA